MAYCPPKFLRMDLPNLMFLYRCPQCNHHILKVSLNRRSNPFFRQGNGEHQLKVDDKLPAAGWRQIALAEIQVALGGDVPHRADGIVELFAQFLQILLPSFLTISWSGARCDLNVGSPLLRILSAQS